MRSESYECTTALPSGTKRGGISRRDMSQMCRPRPPVSWAATCDEGDDDVGGVSVEVLSATIINGRRPLRLPTGADVLVCHRESRVVEASAQERCALTVVALNGNPSGDGAALGRPAPGLRGRHCATHGDFDAAGLRICAASVVWYLVWQPRR